MLLRPMYPWLYVARLAQYREPTINNKKGSRNTDSSLRMTATGVFLCVFFAVSTQNVKPHNMQKLKHSNENCLSSC